jgi:hypothetical protein
LFTGKSENIEDIVLSNFFSAKGNQLIEHRLCIAQAALRAARDRVRGSRFQSDLLLLRDELQVLRDEICRDAMQIEPLAAAQDGCQNFLRLGRSKNKFHVLGRLFQRLQKRVERGR